MAAGKEAKNRVSLDASRFQRGTSQVRKNIKQLERGLTVDMKKAAQIGKRSILALGAGTAAAAAGITVGINKAIQLGARLDHLSTQTGVAAGNLRVLEQAFEDAGVGADQVGRTISRLQRRIVKADNGSASYKRALDAVGLSTGELIAQKPGEQFETVSRAIAGMSNQSRKAQVAMELFGNQGAELMGVFEEGSLDSAADSLGGQAELLNKNAALFEKASTLMGRAGNKLEGFFVGVADKVVPVIMPMLERLDGLDIAGQGQRFGEGLRSGLRAVLGLFEGGTFGDLVRTELIRSGKIFVNTVARGLLGVVNGLRKFWFEGITSVFKNSVSVLKDGLVASAKAFGAVLLEKIGEALDKIPGFGGKAEDLKDAGKALAEEADSGFKNALKTLEEADPLGDALKGFADGMADLDGFNLIDVSKDKEKMKRILENAIDSVDTNSGAAGRARGDGGGGGENGGGLPTGQPGGKGDKAESAPAFAQASSLARIGGGGGVGGANTLVDQTRRQTGLLEQIRAETKRQTQEIRNGFMESLGANTVLG